MIMPDLTCATETIEIPALHGETVATWAYRGYVVIEIEDADLMAGAHLTIAQAERLMVALPYMVAEAKRLIGVPCE